MNRNIELSIAGEKARGPLAVVALLILAVIVDAIITVALTAAAMML